MFARTKGRAHYNIRSIFLSTNNRSVMSVDEKQKYHITFFCEKHKSITFHHVLPTLLKAFSCGLCYSDRRIILSLLREKESKLLCFQEEQKGNYIKILSTNNKVSCFKYLHYRAKTKVSYCILLREKQKFNIT